MGATALRASLCLLLGLACARPAADDRQPGSDALEAIVRRVEAVRGIRAGRPIDARVVGPERMREIIENAIVEGRSRDEIARYEAGLVTVGLWPPDRALLDAFVAVMSEEVVGLYLADERVLLVVGDAEGLPFSGWLAIALARRDFVAEFALSHELVHLLQHQRYPELLEPDTLYFSHDDLAIAVQCAFEGDAMVFGILALGGPLPEPAFFAASFDAQLDQRDGEIADAPRLLRELLAFPYSEGYRLASREGAQLLEDPPASSEQVLHEDRRHADFTVFDLSLLRAALPDRCEVVFENTVGELQTRILLQELSANDVSSSAWDGWDGDRYLAVDCAGRRALLWLTAWDSEADAQEFRGAYAAIADEVAARAALSGPLRVERVGRDVIISSRELQELGQHAPRQAVRERLRTVAALRAFWQQR